MRRRAGQGDHIAQLLRYVTASFSASVDPEAAAKLARNAFVLATMWHCKLDVYSVLALHVQHFCAPGLRRAGSIEELARMCEYVPVGAALCVRPDVYPEMFEMRRTDDVTCPVLWLRELLAARVHVPGRQRLVPPGPARECCGQLTSELWALATRGRGDPCL